MKKRWELKEQGNTGIVERLSAELKILLN